MSLAKTSLLNGVAVVIKVVSGLLLNKIFAVYVGPAGYAVVGQFQNAVTIIVSLAGGVFSTGVTKATAQHFDDESRQHTVWKTAFRFSLVASLVAGVFLLLFGSRLSELLLHRGDMSGVFIWLALALPAMAANNLLLAVVNGKKELAIYVSANILASLISLLVAGLLVYNFGLYGALLAFTINPALTLIATAMMVSRKRWFNTKNIWGNMSRPALRELSGFGLMSLTSAMVVPASFMLIRDLLTNQLGLTATGYWQASWKISEIYLMLVTATLSVYYLPRLAEIRTSTELKIEVFKVYRFVMPIVIASAAMIYFFRDPIILFLFSTSFLPMRELFVWQLSGDVIKIGSWILAYIMLGRAMIRAFIVTEIWFSLQFVLLSWGLVNQFGLIGVPMGYVVNYCVYWVVVGYLVKREMKKMRATDD